MWSLNKNAKKTKTNGNNPSAKEIFIIKAKLLKSYSFSVYIRIIIGTLYINVMDTLTDVFDIQITLKFNKVSL